ncbi:VirK/YbjX family protein [Methylotenera sp.]|uniref:VirK/YbjX family protein n=1 Tax=Methylotenera sp. TaxID=2051956 RepID=UPI00351FD426
MVYKDFIWLWKVSKQVCTGSFISAFKGRLMFMLKAVRISNTLQPFLRCKEGDPLNMLLTHRPETIGAIVWPYQCRTWDAKTRLQKIEEHYSVIGDLSSTIDFPVNGALKLLDLGDVYEKLHVVLDQPIWFIREGQLVLNLFLDNVRIYSLAFSFSRDSGEVAAYVGAIQGRKIDGLADTYKDITKSMHGMRPRDFLFELFRAFCRAAGVSKIFAVSDSNRHHRSSYFGSKIKKAESAVNYDEIWLERGGVLLNSDFYLFSVDSQMKNLDEVPSKKRSMYRRRYQFLEATEEQMLDVCANLDNNNLLVCPFHSL